MSNIKQEFDEAFSKEHGSESLEDGGDSLYWIAIWSAKWAFDKASLTYKNHCFRKLDCVACAMAKDIIKLAKEL